MKGRPNQALQPTAGAGRFLCVVGSVAPTAAELGRSAAEGLQVAEARLSHGGAGVIDRDAARSLVTWQLAVMPPAAPGDGYVLLDGAEFAWGWVFGYDSRLHQETGDDSHMLLGNAPYLVRRADGAVFVAGTALPVETYIQDLASGRCRLVERCV